MNVKLLDIVALEKDIPEYGLRKDDIGAVVEIYEPDAFEVEFVLGNGRTQALLTLTSSDVRSVAGNEILSVRELAAV